MGINFPPSPAIGTLWPNPAIAGVPQYTWNGTVWTTVLAPPAFYVSDTAPTGAPINALWWDSNAGVLYINYKDASSTQWVATSATPVIDTTNFVARTAISTNRVVNGAMQISQEWGNTLHGPTPTPSFYPADQWRTLGSISPGTLTVQRVQSVTPQGSQDRIRVVVQAAKTTLTAGDYLQIYQVIEGNRVADFRFGSAQAKQVILRFGFKGPAGTYTIKIGNSPATRSYLANFIITAGQANTDTEQVIVIPGDTTGVWAIDNTAGVGFSISLATGTNFHGVLGWQAGNLSGTAATSNGMAATNNTFELFDVGLYLDADNIGVPPKWTMPDYARELEACMRYYQASLAGWTGDSVATGGYTAWIMFTVPMRILPVLEIITFINTGAGNFTSATSSAVNDRGFSVTGTASNSINGSAYLTSCTYSARM